MLINLVICEPSIEDMQALIPILRDDLLKRPRFSTQNNRTRLLTSTLTLIGDPEFDLDLLTAITIGIGYLSGVTGPEVILFKEIDAKVALLRALDTNKEKPNNEPNLTAILGCLVRLTTQ